jgi:hypothetical protein
MTAQSGFEHQMTQKYDWKPSLLGFTHCLLGRWRCPAHACLRRLSQLASQWLANSPGQPSDIELLILSGDMTVGKPLESIGRNP